ncbi:MAG: hypothetical protein Q7S21_01905 [archaeon]|nr:hypothetical protein [archaeon]
MKQKTLTVSKKQAKSNQKKTNSKDEVDWDFVQRLEKSLKEIRDGKAIRVR